MADVRRYKVLIWNVDSSCDESTRLCGAPALAAAVDLAYKELAAIEEGDDTRLVVVVKDDDAAGRGPQSEAVSALLDIVNECEGHRFGQQGYDMTLDHIYEMATVALDALAAHSGRGEKP